MSPWRLVLSHTAASGWAAFLGWLCGEALFARRASSPDTPTLALVGACVGACLGAGLALLAAAPGQRMPRLLLGLVCGGVGGALGGLAHGLMGAMPAWYGAPCWVLLGLGVGAAAGGARFPAGLWSGLLAGGLGGLVGGLLFEGILLAVGDGAVLFGRATAFVALGIPIGVFTGLVAQAGKEEQSAPVPEAATLQRFRPPVAPARPLSIPVPAPGRPAEPIRPSAAPPAQGNLRPRPAAPAVSPAPVAANACPTCGRSVPGVPGQRYCMICERKF